MKIGKTECFLTLSIEEIKLQDEQLSNLNRFGANFNWGCPGRVLLGHCNNFWIPTPISRYGPGYGHVTTPLKAPHSSPYLGIGVKLQILYGAPTPSTKIWAKLAQG